jgi:hypothetical protein
MRESAYSFLNFVTCKHFLNCSLTFIKYCQSNTKVGHEIYTNNSHDTHIHIKFTHVPNDKTGGSTTHETLIRRA